MLGLSQLLQAVSLGLVLLLPLVNPLTSVALLLSLSGNMTPKEVKHQAMMASIYVFIIMVVAFYAGQVVMNTFGISIPGLRIAGGLIVAHIGFRMLFPPHKQDKSSIVDAKHQEMLTEGAENIAFVPLAMPGSAGPGTIAMIISSVSTLKDNHLGFESWVLTVSPVIIFATISIILWVCLDGSSYIMKLMGKSGIEAISRLMGFLLVCVGVQFIINGVLEIVAAH